METEHLEDLVLFCSFFCVLKVIEFVFDVNRGLDRRDQE